MGNLEISTAINSLLVMTILLEAAILILVIGIFRGWWNDLPTILDKNGQIKKDRIPNDWFTCDHYIRTSLQHAHQCKSTDPMRPMHGVSVDGRIYHEARIFSDE